MLGGGGETKDTSTRPEDAPQEMARTPVPAGAELPHWTYQGAEGAEYWGVLAEDWATCLSGRQQSPIDVKEGTPFVAEDKAPAAEDAPPEESTTATAKKAKATTTTAAKGAAKGAATTTTEVAWPGAPAEQEIDFRYHPSAYTVVDNGHTVQINLNNAGAMVIDGVEFKLLQFHFHAPSEHTLSEAAYPLEYHLVHRSEAGELAVVGVLVQRGALNKTLEPVFDDLPDAGVTLEGLEPINPIDLLPANRTMVRYNGSLTTPPCAEHVRWHLMLTPKQMSKLQVARFVARHPNSSRPVQALNDREVVIEVDKVTSVAGATDHGASSGASRTEKPASHGSTPTAIADSGAGASKGSADHPATTAATTAATATTATDSHSAPVPAPAPAPADDHPATAAGH